MTIETNGAETWLRCNSGDGSVMSIGVDREEGNFSINVVTYTFEAATVLVIPAAEMMMLARLLDFHARQMLQADIDPQPTAPVPT